MKKGLGVLAIAAACAIAGCQKNTLSKVPHISDLRLAPDSIRVGPGSRDTVFMRFDFTDGDADLGSPGGDIYVRNILGTAPAPSRFSIGEDLTGFDDPELGMRGSSLIVLPASYPDFEIADTLVTRDTVQFEVYLRDKAGNESNRLTTGQLILLNR